jgi:hypothetical protein
VGQRGVLGPGDRHAPDVILRRLAHSDSWAPISP